MNQDINPYEAPTAGNISEIETRPPSRRRRVVTGVLWILAPLVFSPIIALSKRNPLILMCQVAAAWACFGASVGAFFGRQWRGMVVGLCIMVAIVLLGVAVRR